MLDYQDAKSIHLYRDWRYWGPLLTEAQFGYLLYFSVPVMKFSIPLNLTVKCSPSFQIPFECFDNGEMINDIALNT